MSTISTAKEYQRFLGSRGTLWHGQETGHNDCYRGTVGRPATTILSRAASTTDEHHRCRCRLVVQSCAWHGQWLNDKVRTILGGTPNVATHDMHASASADTRTLFRDWASEVRRRSCVRDLGPTHDGPHGSSTHRGTRAKTNGNTRRTLITAVSFRAQALNVFYHRHRLVFKGRFWPP